MILRGLLPFGWPSAVAGFCAMVKITLFFCAKVGLIVWLRGYEVGYVLRAISSGWGDEDSALG